MKEILDIPFHTPPFMRMIVKILESHQVGDVTVVDKMEIEKIYIPASVDPEYQSSASKVNNDG